jgi:hypothetical protein
MKKIEDYDIEEVFTSDKLKRESFLDIIKPCPMWAIDKQKIVKSAMTQWLKIDDSEKSRDHLFCEMLRRSYFAKDQSIKSTLFYDSFDAITDFKDKHCAIVWKSLYRFIPESGPYTHSWHILACKLNQHLPDLQYKEFKSSIVDNALKEGKYGFIRLLLLSDKSILKPRHLPRILGSRSLFEELGDIVPSIKMPATYSEKIENILLKALNSLNGDMENNVDRKSNNALLDFIIIQTKNYSQDNNIGEKLLPIIQQFDSQKLKTIKDSGLIELLSHNKMSHELSVKPITHKSFKL